MSASDDLHHEPDAEEAEPLLAEEEPLLQALSARWLRPDKGGLLLCEETCDRLDQVCPPVELDRRTERRLTAVALQAETDAAFTAGEQARHRAPSLGSYLLFLRTRAGLSLAEAAQQLRVPFQLLASLERDGLGPAELRARRLATIFRKLSGSLAMTERLVLSTVRAHRLRPARGAPRLYRGAPGASRSASEAASHAAHRRQEPLEPNPDWLEERASALRLAAELRSVWRSTRSPRSGPKPDSSGGRSPD